MKTQDKNNTIRVSIRKKQYDVEIKNQGKKTCVVQFVYNKKHFTTNEFIPNVITKKELVPALQSILQREIYNYNKQRVLLSKTREMYGKQVNLMPEE